MHNSWYANLPRMQPRGRARNPLYAHPDDLRERGIEPGSKVCVWNEHGGVEVEVAADPGLVRGVVALTHGFGNARTPGMRRAQGSPGVNANALLPVGPESFEPLSSQAHMTGVAVELAPL
jgi:anaerobic selenocysteine-containing dehydrogenase